MTEESKKVDTPGPQESTGENAVEKSETLAEADDVATETVDDSAEGAASVKTIEDLAAPRKKRIPSWVWVVLLILFNVLIWILFPRHK